MAKQLLLLLCMQSIRDLLKKNRWKNECKSDTYWYCFRSLMSMKFAQQGACGVIQSSPGSPKVTKQLVEHQPHRSLYGSMQIIYRFNTYIPIKYSPQVKEFYIHSAACIQQTRRTLIGVLFNSFNLHRYLKLGLFKIFSSV